MTDFYGYGKEKRRLVNIDILSGRVVFRYAAHVLPSIHSRSHSRTTQRRISGDDGERQPKRAHVRGMQAIAQRQWVPILFISPLSVDQNVRLPDIKLDRGFQEFYRYCKSQDIPVIIVSRFGKEGLPSNRR